MLKPLQQRSSPAMIVSIFLAFFLLLLTFQAYPIKAEPTVRKPLPVRTLVVDGFGKQHTQPVASGAYAQRDAKQQRIETQAGLLQAFAIYQEVSPHLSVPRKHPHSIHLCQYDKLGVYSWPPTAVCWFAATATANSPQALQALSTAWQPPPSIPSGYRSSSASHSRPSSSIIVIAEDSRMLLLDASLHLAHKIALSIPEEEMCLLNGSSALHRQTGQEDRLGLRPTMAVVSNALDWGQDVSAPASTKLRTGKLSRLLNLPSALMHDTSAWPGAEWAQCVDHTFKISLVSAQ